MNSDEPALVPQWLQKGGPPGSTGGHNSSSTSQFSLRDNKSLRPKRDTPASSSRPSTTGNRDTVFGRPDREPVRRDRSSRDSWTASALGSSSASYRSAAPAPVRSTRPPPERQVSDNGRSTSEVGRDSFGSAPTNRGGVFRTQSGPPLHDREDFGFGSVAASYDNYRFQPLSGRNPPGRGTLDKHPFEQDFPSLAGRSNASKPWLSGVTSAAEQPWTRLADAPEGGALTPRRPSPGPLPSPRLTPSQDAQTGAGNGEVEPVGRPSMSKLVGSDAVPSQARMADTLQQGPGAGLSHAPSHDKARLEELVMRQSKQLVPVVASGSARDKSKVKSTAAAVGKLAPGGIAASAGALLGSRGKAGLDGGKRADDTSAGPVMTGLGPSLRRLPSADTRSSLGTATTASQPEGTSDAGDSTDGNPGNVKQPAAKELERQRTSFFQSLKRSSKSASQSTSATPTSPASPSAQQPQQPAPPQPAVTSSNKQSAPLSRQPPAAAASASAGNADKVINAAANGVSQPLDASSNASSSKKAASSSKEATQGEKADAPSQPLTQSNGIANGTAPETMNGHKSSSWDANDPQLKVSAEEEAFLRSLGWTEPGDDEDEEGLTEEEIASFKANTQHLSIKSFRPSAESFSGLNASFLRPKPNLGQHGVNRVSQLDEISSSDSESDL